MNDFDKTKNQLITELQQLRQKVELIESDSILLRYNKFISNTKNSISFIDKEYLYFEVNQKYLDTHKLKKEEVVGKFVKDVFGTKVFKNNIKNNIDKCLSGEVIKYQSWFNFPKSERKYMDVAFYPFYDKNNNILGVMVSSHDISELKITEELLAEREQKHNALIHNTPGMVYMGITDWTKEIVGGAEEICGYPDKDLRTGQLEWKNIIHPDDKERITLEIEKLFKKEESKICVYRIITKNGKTRWVEDHMSSFFYEPEGNYRIDGIVLDITKHYETEQLLKESEAYYRTLIEMSSDVISILDKDGNISYESPSHERVLGYKTDSLIGKNSFEFVHPDDRERIAMQFAKLMEKPNEIELVNFRFLHNNGTWRNIEGLGRNLLHLPMIEGIVVNYRDITENKNTDKALKESEEKYKYLIENQGEGICIVNLNEEFIFANPAVHRLFGVKNGELEGKNLSEFFNKEQIKQIKKQTKKRLKKQSDTYELILNSKDGQIKNILVSATPKTDYHGNTTGTLGIFRDITSRKEAEKQILNKNKELKELIATKDKFFSIIAHDLKSPFNTMLGFSKLLIEKFDTYDVETQKKFIGVLGMDIQNTYKLLENLLLWSRSQRGKLSFKTERVNLYLLVLEILNLFKQTAINKSVNLINKLDENIYFMADQDMLLTILRNLISNAIKFTKKEGTVEIGVKTGHGISQPEIYVKDSGIGIPKEMQSKLFNIAESFSTKGTGGEAGTGLGLALCKEFIKKHGGKIWLKSEVGKGSEFIFTLSESK